MTDAPAPARYLCGCLLLLLATSPCQADWTAMYETSNDFIAMTPLSPSGLVTVGGPDVARLGGDGSVSWGRRAIEDEHTIHFMSCATLSDNSVALIARLDIASGHETPMVCKIDPQGEISWARQFPDASPSILNGIVVAEDDTIISIGSRDLGTDTEALWLIAMDPSGQVLWERAYESFWSAGRTISIARNGDLVISGNRFFQTVGSLPPAGPGFVARLDPGGNGQWGVFFPRPEEPFDTTTQIITAAVELSNGDVLAAGAGGPMGTSGWVTLFWSISAYGYSQGVWSAPDLGWPTAGSRGVDDFGPVFWGGPKMAGVESSWFWSGQPGAAGAWGRLITGPDNEGGLFAGFRASNGDLLFSSWLGGQGPVIWRTSPDGLMPQCGFTEEADLTFQGPSNQPIHGSFSLSSVQTTVENFPMALEIHQLEPSYFCGEPVIAPAIPVHNDFGIALFVSLLLVAGMAICNKHWHP